jgi:hypothetical protein
VVGLVYAKSVTLSRGARRKISSGKLIQLQSKDADKMETFVLFAHNLWSAPINAAWIALLLMYLLGFASVV